MSRFSMLLLASILASPVFISTPAAAMDPGTYRPGMAYDSITSKDPSMCEAQCSGDAQCRGWNFVKINPNAPIGVCEFNAQAAAPVPSTYSISGENSSAVRSATIIPGRSNTVRVGNMSAPAAQQTSPKRRVVREAVPQRVQPRGAAYRPVAKPPVPRSVQRSASGNVQNMSLTEQQNLHRRQAMRPTAPQPQRRPQFQHNLEGGPAATRRAAPQAARPMMPPTQRPQMGGDPRLQQRLMQKQRIQGAQIPTRQMQRPQAAPPHSRPAASIPRQVDPRQAESRLTPKGQTFPPSAMPPQPSTMQRPQGYPQQAPQRQAYAAPQRPRVNIPAEMSPRQPMSAAQAEQSLYGSLYDDVKVPRPIDAAAFAANPDAPIPTVANVPVAPVQVGPLPQARQKAGPPAASNASGLAGGAN